MLETRDASTARWGRRRPWRPWPRPNLDVRPPADRAGVRRGCGAGRPARGRDPGGRARPLRLHRAGPRASGSCATSSPTRSWSAGTSPTAGPRPRTCRGAHPRRAVHGHHRAAPGQALLQRITAARAGRRWTAAASCCRRRPASAPSPRTRGHRRRGPAHHPAARDGGNVDIKQLGSGRPAAHPGGHPGRAVLGRRRALRPGRLRDLRHRHRDARDPERPLRRAQGRGAPSSGIRDLQFARDDYGLPPGVRRAAPLLRHHRPVGHPRRREPLRGR